MFAQDADVIQFASGLEWAEPNETPQNKHRDIVIGYGINDCESAMVTVDWDSVASMLLPVEPGTEVAHTMKNLSRQEFHSASVSPS